MANAIYPLYKDAVLTSAANSAINGAAALKAALVDTATYTYSAAHQFATSLTGIVGTPQAISAPSTSGGVVDGGDVTFSAVTGAAVAAIALYLDTGVAGTSRLVAYLDTGITGLPVTPNGGSITITWDNGANKIFAL
jgi:hypothetical protein